MQRKHVFLSVILCSSSTYMPTLMSNFPDNPVPGHQIQFHAHYTLLDPKKMMWMHN